jgi:uncharacterized protein with HEPN domain
MHLDERDLSYIWDMHQATKEVLVFMEGATYAIFEKDRKLRYAVERQLLVIGEAAAHVSEEFQELHSEIPWTQIIGQRNVLAHDYGEILVDRIWLTATQNLPELLTNLARLLPEEK